MQASVFIDFWIKSMRIHKPDAREGELLAAFGKAVEQKCYQLSLRKRNGVEPIEYDDTQGFQDGNGYFESSGTSTTNESEDQIILASDVEEECKGEFPGSGSKTPTGFYGVQSIVTDAPSAASGGQSGSASRTEDMEVDLGGVGWEDVCADRQFRSTRSGKI
jgi:hypothetical protein